MPSAVYVPRINNNDDSVKVVRLAVAVGDRVAQGDIVADIESDKSISTVESEEDGYVLKVLCGVDEQVAVGSVMMWLGATPNEAPPEIVETATAKSARAEPTAKARALLTQHGLSTADVPAS